MIQLTDTPTPESGNAHAESIWSLLSRTEEMGGSDLHISSGRPVAIRIDGDIRIDEKPPLSAETVASYLHEVMNPAQRESFSATLDCDFSIETPGGMRFRVNAFLQFRGVSAVFRVIASEPPSLTELGCPAVIAQIITKASGLVLVTGPTGSGKSTTLAAAIDFINERFPFHILTIEDPIEFVHSGRKSVISQREVHSHTLGFSNALRAALREDPDCILVGELRDLETIRLALSAAETGHLVLATLHTSSAAKSLDRLIDVFPGDEKAVVRAMLSESLSAVVSQTLLKRRAGGRVAAWEIMICNPAIRNLIREGKTAQMYSTMQTSQSQGMVTMDQSITELVRQSVISQEEANRVMRTRVV